MIQEVCLKIELHEIHEIHEIHKLYEIHTFIKRYRKKGKHIISVTKQLGLLVRGPPMSIFVRFVDFDI